MKTFTQKKEVLSKLKDKLAKSKITVFTSFAREGMKGMSVADMRDLKKSLYAMESEYVVEKKTLLNKVLKDSKKNVDVSEYQGSLGVVFGYTEETAIAKSVYTFSKKNPSFKYFSALLGSEFLDEAKFTEFAKLPSREVMLGRLVGLLAHPMRSFAIVIDQIAKAK